MEYVKEFMNNYGLSIIHTILLSFISYISLSIKKIHQNYINDKTKKEVITTVCNAVNKMYSNLSEEDKLNKAVTNIESILKEKNIAINDLELRMYIISNISTYKEVDNNVSNNLSSR